MKLADQQTEVKSNMTFDETVAMNIDHDAVAMVIQRLISTYNNPYRAVLREYTSNAYDAHVAHKVTKPVEVTLPDRLSPTLTVRDYGKGLSREELKGFGQFGVSTKRGSNEYVGGFGIGSKAGLAVSAQFTVSSIKDGRRNTAVISRDEQNRPNMNFLEEVDTTEPSGTTITVPISDPTLFGDLDDFFLGWKPGSILINDAEPKKSLYNTEQFIPAKNGRGWHDRKNVPSGRDVLRVMIGPVFYLLRYDKLGLNYNQWNILKYSVINLENGSVEIAPSREDLIYNARTKTAVAEQIKELMSLASAVKQEEIDNLTDLKSALTLIDNFARQGYNTEGLKWKNKSIPLAGATINGNTLPDPRITHASPTRNSNTKTGWQVDKDRMNLSNFQPWKYHLFSKTVIIHSATGLTRVGSRGREVHRESLGVADWLSAQDNADSSTWEFYIMEEPLNRIPFPYRDLVSVVLSADEFNETVRKVRAERAEEERKTKDAKKAEQKLRILTDSYYGSASTSEMMIKDIKSSYDHTLILRNQDPGVAGSLRRQLTTKISYDRFTAPRFLTMVQEKKVALILVNKNDDLTDVMDSLPPVVTVDDLAAEAITSTTTSFTPMQARALKDRQSNKNVAVLTNLSEDKLKKIKRAETREWALAMKNYEDTGANLRERLRWYSERSDCPKSKAAMVEAEASKNVTDLPNSPYGRYPMLEIVSNYWRVDGNIVIDYLNFCDKKITKIKKNKS